MAYTIVNGPTVLRSEGSVIMSIKLDLTYDDPERTVKSVELNNGDLIRVKYMSAEYSPEMKEVQGRLNKFSVSSKRKRPVRGENIFNPGNYVEFIEIDNSSDNYNSLVVIPIAAIREVEFISCDAGANAKPDCEDPGDNCPHNPACQCPAHVEKENCTCGKPGCPNEERPEKPPTQDPSDENPDEERPSKPPVKPSRPDDKPSWEYYYDKNVVAVIGKREFTDFQTAIEQATSNDIIFVIEVPRKKDEQIYHITKKVIISSYDSYFHAKINGAFHVSSKEQVSFSHLEIIHNGIDKELSGIEAVNGSVFVNNCVFKLDGYEVPKHIHEIPKAMNISASIGAKAEKVEISNVVLSGYPLCEMTDALGNIELSSGIVLTRNYGDVYADFPFTIDENITIDRDSEGPHLIVCDQNFGGETGISSLVVNGSPATPDGLRELLKYNGNIVIPEGVTLDLERDEFSFTLGKDRRMYIYGIFCLGDRNTLTNNGELKVVDDGLFVGGLIIDNGTITKRDARRNAFLAVKLRKNGAQSLLDESKFN